MSDWRNRRVSDPEFRRKVQKIPIIRGFAQSSANRLFAYATGFVHTQILSACVRLNLFEHLHKSPMTAGELAQHLDLPASRLETMLLGAQSLELIERRDDHRFYLGPLGCSLIDNPGLVGFIRHHGVLYRDLTDPLALLDGSLDTELRDYWPYPETTERQDDQQFSRYSQLMGESQHFVAEEVVSSFDMSPYHRLLDIGGGDGSFAIAMAKRWSHLRITVADLPQVANIAQAKIKKAGLDQRIDAVGLDFNRDKLPEGFDLVSLVRIVHDHDDDVVSHLFSGAYQALASPGRCIVAEPLADTSRAGRLLQAYFGLYLMAMGQGRPRTYSELEKMLHRAGFDSVQQHSTSVPLLTSLVLADKA